MPPEEHSQRVGAIAQLVSSGANRRVAGVCGCSCQGGEHQDTSLLSLSSCLQQNMTENSGLEAELEQISAVFLPLTSVLP